MRDGVSRLPWLILFLVVLWIVVFWITPAQSPRPDEDLRIRFDALDTASLQEAIATREEASVEQSSPAEEPGDVLSVLEEVAPEELGDEGETGGLRVIPPTSRVYVSREGETLQAISQQFYGTASHWRAIARMNNVDPNRLRPGTRLLIPVDPRNVQGLAVEEVAEVGEEAPPAAPPEPEYTEYIVVSGDTLSDISRALYGRASLWRRIRDANPGINPDRLRPGTVLKIPPPPARD